MKRRRRTEIISLPAFLRPELPTVRIILPVCSGYRSALLPVPYIWPHRWRLSGWESSSSISLLRCSKPEISSSSFFSWFSFFPAFRLLFFLLLPGQFGFCRGSGSGIFRRRIGIAGRSVLPFSPGNNHNCRYNSQAIR